MLLFILLIIFIFYTYNNLSTLKSIWVKAVRAKSLWVYGLSGKIPLGKNMFIREK